MFPALPFFFPSMFLLTATIQNVVGIWNRTEMQDFCRNISGVYLPESNVCASISGGIDSFLDGYSQCNSHANAVATGRPASIKQRHFIPRGHGHYAQDWENVIAMVKAEGVTPGLWVGLQSVRMEKGDNTIAPYELYYCEACGSTTDVNWGYPDATKEVTKLFPNISQTLVTPGNVMISPDGEDLIYGTTDTRSLCEFYQEACPQLTVAIASASGSDATQVTHDVITDEQTSRTWPNTAAGAVAYIGGCPHGLADTKVICTENGTWELEQPGIPLKCMKDFEANRAIFSNYEVRLMKGFQGTTTDGSIDLVVNVTDRFECVNKCLMSGPCFGANFKLVSGNDYECLHINGQVDGETETGEDGDYLAKFF